MHRAAPLVVLLALVAATLGAGCLRAEPPPREATETVCRDLVPLPEVPRAEAAFLRVPVSRTRVPPAEGTVERDGHGVPLVRAGTMEDAFRLLGRAAAEDRLWQMEVYRAAAQGRLAELLGSDGLASDVLVRTVGTTAEERAGMILALEPGTVALLEAYLSGVNDHVAAVLADPTRLPLEHAALGVEPAPWSLDDAAALAAHFWTLASFETGSEAAPALLRLRLAETVGEERAQAYFDDLVPAGAPGMPATAPPSLLRHARVDPPARVPDDQLEAVRVAAPLLARAATVPADLPSLDADVLRLLPSFGSNMVLVAPSRSASGALLLGGPQVGYSTPNVFWEAALEVDGVGWRLLSVPGYLGLGRYGSLALSVTVGYGDQTDLVVLRLDAADPERYLWDGASVPFDRRMERFAVLDRRAGSGVLGGDALGVIQRALAAPPGPHEVTVRRAPHVGPIVAHDAELGLAVAMRKAGRGDEMAVLDLLMSPRMLEASRDAAAGRAFVDEQVGRAQPSTNVFIAYADGGIAWHHTGRVPARAEAYDRRLPVPGGSASDWRGLWAPTCMPAIRDPDQGWLANWNNAPTEGWSNLAPMPWVWGREHRVESLQRIVEETLAEGPTTLDALAAANRRASQMDNHAHALVPALLRHAPAEHPVGRAVAAWHAAGLPIVDEDGDGRVDDAGVAAWEAWRSRLQEAVFRDELGDRTREMRWGTEIRGGNNDDHGTSTWGEHLLLDLAEGSARADWWDDVRTPRREGRDEVVSATLAGALADLRAAHGEDWRRPMVEVVFSALGAAPEARMPQQNRGSVNLLADMASGETWTIVPPGNSGHVPLGGPAGLAANPHLDDQLAMYVRHQYKRTD